MTQPARPEALELPSSPPTTGADAPILPSRARLLDRMGSAVLSGAGIVLLTGEPGVGKTWLLDRLLECLPIGWQPVRWDTTPDAGPRDLLDALAQVVGTSTEPGHLAAGLRAAHEDGNQMLLVLDEFHNAGEALIEQVRLLSNRLGNPETVAGIVACGQTALLPRITSPRHRAFQSRVVLHVHLRGLDIFEAAQFLEPRVRSAADLESMHRRTLGNPRALLHALAATAATPRAPALADPVDAAESSRRPPVRYDEHSIEVGWPAVEPWASLAREDSAPAEPIRGVEPIDDLYAELQALAEIEHPAHRASRETAWHPAPRPAAAEEFVGAAPAGRRPRVRVEAQHDLAPSGHHLGESASGEPESRDAS